MENTIRCTALALASAFIVTLDIETARAAEAQASLPPAPLRPDAEMGPTKISLTIWASDISKIDSAVADVHREPLRRMRWHDTRLAHPVIGVKTYALADIWHPELLVANDTVRRTLPETVEAAPDGTANYRQRFTGSFAQRLDLRAFPFDQHRFGARFLVVGYRPEEIQFIPDEAGSRGPSAGSWDRRDPDAGGLESGRSRGSYSAVPCGARLATAGYAFEFHATRLAQYHLLKVMVPLLLIVMMSWTAFGLIQPMAAPQISVAVTSMLTLIAYRFAIGSEVPKLPYLTRLDAFILASSLLVFRSLIEVMVMVTTNSRPTTERNLPGLSTVDAHFLPADLHRRVRGNLPALKNAKHLNVNCQRPAPSEHPPRHTVV